MGEENINLLSEKTRAEIDRWLTKYPSDQKQSAVITALHLVQADNGGWLTEKLMDEVAAYLEMPNIAVYEVASFYSMYDLEPTGRHKICVCTNISCMLADSDEVVEHIKKRLDINVGETTEDGKFTLKEVECLAACVGAPMMMIGGDYYEHLTPEKIDKILDDKINE